MDWILSKSWSTLSLKEDTVPNVNHSSPSPGSSTSAMTRKKERNLPGPSCPESVHQPTSSQATSCQQKLHRAHTARWSQNIHALKLPLPHANCCDSRIRKFVWHGHGYVGVGICRRRFCVERRVGGCLPMRRFPQCGDRICVACCLFF